MAMRRSVSRMGDEAGYGDEFEGDSSFDRLFGMFGESPMSGGDPSQGQPVEASFGGVPDLPPTFMDRSEPTAGPSDVAEGERREGNTERGREFMPDTRPNTYASPAPPASPEYSLPEGVTVSPDMFGGVPESSNNLPTPNSPREPSPSVMAAIPPSVQPTESGPQRRPLAPAPVAASSAPSMLFDQGASSGAGLFGGAGGLNDGGFGVAATPGGPQATKMMLALMRSLRGGEG